jgi:hypothetical protein
LLKGFRGIRTLEKLRLAPPYLADLAKINKEFPEVYAKIESGKLKLQDAKRLVSERKRELRRTGRSSPHIFLASGPKTSDNIPSETALLVVFKSITYGRTGSEVFGPC